MVFSCLRSALILPASGPLHVLAPRAGILHLPQLHFVSSYLFLLILEISASVSPALESQPAIKPYPIHLYHIRAPWHVSHPVSPSSLGSFTRDVNFMNKEIPSDSFTALLPGPSTVPGTR